MIAQKSPAECGRAMFHRAPLEFKGAKISWQHNCSRPRRVTQPKPSSEGSGILYCKERHRLTDAVLAAIHHLSGLQAQQARAIMEDDPDFSRFDDLIHMARMAKDDAKYALLAHIEGHRC